MKKEIYSFLDWLAVIVSYSMFLLLYVMIVFSVSNDGKLLIHTNDYNEMVIEVIVFGALLLLAIWRAPSLIKKMHTDVKSTYIYPEVKKTVKLNHAIEELSADQQESLCFSFLT